MLTTQKVRPLIRCSLSIFLYVQGVRRIFTFPIDFFTPIYMTDSEIG